MLKIPNFTKKIHEIKNQHSSLLDSILIIISHCVSVRTPACNEGSATRESR